MRGFSERAPFPGYPARDSLAWLRARAGRSPFERLLDQAIPGDARVLEMGCGTGQMSLYLARADRVVVGADLTRGSLLLAAASGSIVCGSWKPTCAARVCGRARSMWSTHRASCTTRRTRARPSPALRSLDDRLRRLVARISRYRVIPFDPVLRDRANEPGRREAWLRDQYLPPEEHRHTLAEVQGWFAENGVEYVRAYPSALIGDDSGDNQCDNQCDDQCDDRGDGRDDGHDDLFAWAADNWRPEAWLAQLGWIRTLGQEGGLFGTVGRRGVH